MAALRSTFLAIALFAAAPVAADPVDRWSSYIDEASARFGIPAEWIRRVMRAESNGRTMLRGKAVVSSAGAVGLMQLMPGTWADMRALLRLGPDPQDPHDNILAGTAYLRLMHDRFGYPALFAAYNAGPLRYAAALSGRRSLPAETRRYLADVARSDARHLNLQPSRPRLFIASADYSSAPQRPTSTPAARTGGLFVPLTAGSRP